jgi:hypothetical protein
MENRLYQPDKYPDIPSKAKSFKRMINRTVLFILGRALQSLSGHDKNIQNEVCTWQDELTLLMQIKPDGGAMAVRRNQEGKLIYLGADLPENQADIIIFIKNVETAFKIFTGQMGTATAYARHQIAAKGDISLTVSIMRVINRVETYLFPAFLARRLMKRLPDIPFIKKQALRLRTYLIGIPFGI